MQRLASLMLLAAATTAAGDPIATSQLAPRTVRFTYEARVTVPAGTELLEVWLPLPREEDQSVLDVRLAAAAPVTVVRLPNSGDRAAYLRVPAPRGTVTL